MIPFFNRMFPSTNLQDLNLDWICRRIMELSKGIIAPWINAHNQHWMVYDTVAETFVDSGVSAAGEGTGPQGEPGKSPVIGSNGNWYTWDTDTGAYVDTGEQAGQNQTGLLVPGTVSIIGDSISTYDAPGYKVEGYAMYYPGQTDVDDVSKTWWYQLIKSCRAELLVNASYSGSAASDYYDNRPTLYDRCTSEIIGNPDNIIVEIGTNDSNHDVALGDYDFTTPYANLATSTFRTAYIKGLKALQDRFSSANIVCCIMRMGGSTPDAYVDSIQHICDKLNVTCVKCTNYTVYGTTHANANGMREIVSAFNATGKFWPEKLINIAITAPSSETYTYTGLSVKKFGPLVCVSLNSFSFTEVATAWTTLATNLPPNFSPASIMELLPSTMSSAGGVTTSCRLRVTTGGVLEYARGAANLNYSGLYYYFTAE